MKCQSDLLFCLSNDKTSCLQSDVRRTLKAAADWENAAQGLRRNGKRHVHIQSDEVSLAGSIHVIAINQLKSFELKKMLST